MTGNFPQRRSGRLARHANEDTGSHYGEAWDLPYNHPAVIEGRTLFPSTVVQPMPANSDGTGGVLVSGHNNPKIGRRVEKGAWTTFPIYTLTLEERETCSRSCHHWRTCYGNNMHLARRHQWGQALEDVLDDELAMLQGEHPDGFVVRLHVLGDFYSEDYVRRWRGWLARFPALHCYGYTAWPPATPIGRAVRDLAVERWDRFAIRLSLPRRGHGHREAVAVWNWPPTVEELDDAILCPAQQHATETCGTCGLCWSTTRNIAFAVHGRRSGATQKKREEQGGAELEQQDEQPGEGKATSESAGPSTVEPESDNAGGDTAQPLVETLVAHLRSAGVASMPEIQVVVGQLPVTDVRMALHRLIEAGLVEKTGVTRGTRYHWIGKADETPSEEGRGETIVAQEGEPAGKAPEAPKATPTVHAAAPPPQAAASRVVARPPTSSSDALDDRLRELWDKGEGLGAISVALGLPVPWVKRRAGEIKLDGADAPPEVIDQ